MAPTTRTFRDSIRELSPPWLRTLISEKVMYAIGVQADALGDAVAAAVKTRFPNVYSGESLPYIGRDRKILRGRNETNAVYASRLNRWLDDHATRGGPYALLAQLYAHLAPASFAIDLVYASGRRFRMDANGVVSTRDDVGTWVPDADTAKWARWWLFYAWPTPVAADGIWSDPGIWDDGGVWDSDLTVSEVTDLRAVPKEWNNGHSFGRIVLLSGDVELWDYPEGTWDDPGGIWGETGPAQLVID